MSIPTGLNLIAVLNPTFIGTNIMQQCESLAKQATSRYASSQANLVPARFG